MLVQPIASRPRQAVWGLGFRPFFLGGSLFALLALLLWAGVLAGALEPTPPGGMLAWQEHGKPVEIGAPRPGDDAGR